MNSENAKGLKYDSGKPRMDLIDSEFLTGLAYVLSFGADKYTANNWRAGINYSRVIASMFRHLTAINKGEDVDKESGMLHIDHLACGAMFLSNFIHTKRVELDDRHKVHNILEEYFPETKHKEAGLNADRSEGFGTHLENYCIPDKTVSEGQKRFEKDFLERSGEYLEKQKERNR